MPRIEEWQLTSPFDVLLKRLSEVGSRNTAETNEALDRLRTAIKLTRLDVEIANRRWVIEYSHNNEAEARSALNDLLDERERLIP